MTALITLRDISINFGLAPILDKINLTINDKERVCILGRNGMGKSTLLKIIQGELEPEAGEVIFQSRVHSAKLAQDIPEQGQKTVYEVIADGLSEDERLDSPYKIDRIISRLELGADTLFSSLSGGLKRRVLLGQATVGEPKVLLLDEPTNHLDIKAIEWLEKFIVDFNGSVVFITHDRAFLQRLASRLVEIDRGQIYDYHCNYQQYLERREHELETERSHNKKFDKVLAQEEVWIRQGVKARRTRNEGRVRALEKLRESRAGRREQLGKVNLKAQQIESSGKIVIEAKNLRFCYDNKPIVDDFSTIITRGDKVGLIGPNGVGKSTLLQILLDEIKPQGGTVKHGTKLEIAYFDQMRSQLDETKSVADNVSYGDQTIMFNGSSKHVMSYLQDFLFTPERARTAVKYLSGGERNRLLLARLFTKPANVLVLDEPTNDLDLETLELLEDLLANYEGTLLLVSHDRYFLDNTVTSTIVFEGHGKVTEYVGGYADWLRQTSGISQSPITDKSVKKQQESVEPASFQQQKKMRALERKIEKLEIRQAEYQQKLCAPELYEANNSDQLEKAQASLKKITAELDDLWQEYETLSST